MQNKYLQKNCSRLQAGFIQHHFYSGYKSGAGFTLVETLLAIAILSMAIVAPLGIASSGITAATTGKDRLIAIELAQDAIETIRNIRDQNRLRGDSWLSGLDECVSPKFCVVDSLPSFGNNNIIKSSGKGALRIQKDDGLYGYQPGNGWSDSPFSRSVVVTEISANKEIRVVATVTWKTIFTTKSVVLVSHLMKW
ncbi:MAG: hypothetical protein A3C06_01580 [Candidatus Taylorbacteria bacterium RIFCSPHIGHO2_02_FULL_46_13]|uniref:Type II secretion system protein GspI C-terminal domain-containing protein n=1 Tax=Candidatus Taylorbacteria bacterium RIFCSPHIGHO2_02_FULL_46_13 TaxID=1802312 RepID=A0A1G2MR89_9BACT|nr:MAG: hypothetical protein A3C06_01580 [Candidatus Taylorbacteria bacterium RIFCSPHIGHO2_02_FULL_46_13]